MDNARKLPRIVGAAALVAGLAAGGISRTVAAPAPDSRSVLILESAVHGGASSIEARQAAALGYTVVLATDEVFASLTAEEFASYRAILLGDSLCEDRTMMAAALGTRGVWGSAVTGNIMVIGAHPAGVRRSPAGAEALVGRGIDFATGGDGTGLYVNLGCYYSPAPGSRIDVLDVVGEFTAVGQAGCPGQAHLVASHPALDALTDGDLSRWSRVPGQCDTETGFLSWPPSFEVVAISQDAGSSFTAPDGVSGSPYILGRGRGLVPILCGDGALEGTELCDDGNNLDGDGCSASCRFELGVPEVPLTTGLMAPPPQIASTTITSNLQFSGSRAVQSVGGGVICDGCAPDAFFDGDDVGLGARVFVDVDASWSPTATVEHAFSPERLRQGETMDLVNTLTGASGPLTITYAATGDAGVYFNSSFPADSSRRNTFSVSASTTGTGTCALRLDGDPGYSCTASKRFNIINEDFTILGVGLHLDIDLVIETRLTIAPDGVVTIRSVKVGGVITQSGPITFHGPSPSVLADFFPVSCVAPVGSDLVYTLASPTSTPDETPRTNVDIDASLAIDFAPDPPDLEFTILSLTGSTRTMVLVAGTAEATLGIIGADARPPIVNAGGPYAGLEGTAIPFSAAGTTDNCASTLSYQWDYSDGGVAYGIGPFHSFNDNATYSGRLSVVDQAGNRSLKDFSVSVDNVRPFVDAGPETMEAWGVPVAFNGQAVDPGSADQSTLTYRWTFGDGSPSATGGASVTHPYALPGIYMASFRACDKDWACTTDFRTVTIKKRDTTVGYLGDHSGVFDTMTSMNASLVDALGTSIPNRSIDFSIGAESGGTSRTNWSGMANSQHRLGLGAGSYTAMASFAGDGLYNASSDTASYTVFQKPTAVTYTGATSGGPNKTISLSAMLTDSEGNPLAGRIVTFQLGSQSASATTDASGVAATTLQLNQRNGTYSLTSTYTPAGGDSSLYLGSTSSVTFTIQGGG